MGKIIEKAKGTFIALPLPPGVDFIPGYKYALWNDEANRFNILTYKEPEEYGWGIFINKGERYETRVWLGNLVEFYVKINEELYPIHRMNWNRISNMKLKPDMEIDIGLNEDNGVKIAHIKDLSIETLQDVQSLYRLGMIDGYTAIRLSYKLGKVGLGTKIFITDL